MTLDLIEEVFTFIVPFVILGELFYPVCKCSDLCWVFVSNCHVWHMKLDTLLNFLSVLIVLQYISITQYKPDFLLPDYISSPSTTL